MVRAASGLILAPPRRLPDTHWMTDPHVSRASASGRRHRLPAVGAQAQQVHVWRAVASASTSLGDPLHGQHAPDQEHALWRSASAKRAQVAQSRILVREILRGYELPFLGESPFGARSLWPESLRNAGASVSHSGAVVLLAVACSCSVGIDVERVRRGVRVDNVIRRFFSDEEQRGLLSLREPDRETAFFRTWVRKEAYLKAVGGGVPAGLPRFSVSVAPGEPPAILYTELEPGGDPSFSLYDINVPEGYAGALAVEGTGHRIRYMSR